MSWAAVPAPDRVKPALEHHLPSVLALLLTLRAQLRPHGGEPELLLLPSLCRGDTVAIDVGANHGHYSLALLRLCGRVIAIEPNPHALRVLKARFAKALREGRLNLVEAAVGACEQTTVSLFVPNAGSALGSIGAPAPGADGETIEVPLLSLDALAAHERVGFIKIDVEGHEASVLRGASKVLAENRPTLLIEIEERHHAGAFREVCEVLDPLGYRGYFLLDGRMQPIERFDAERLQSRAALNAAGTRRLKNCVYVNNFVFSTQALPCFA
jgi:FkbM family methyltransferase